EGGDDDRTVPARRRLYRQWNMFTRKLHRRCCDSSCEDVAAAGDRSNQLLRIVAQRTADVEQTLRQRIAPYRRVRPDRLDQRGLRHEPTVVLHEVGQSFKRFGPKRYLLATSAQEAALQVQLELTKRVLATWLLSRTWLTAAHSVFSP